MSKQNTDQGAPSPPLASGSGERDARCESLRASIARLQAELAERQAQARPMPSSVMRAYRKLIDRRFGELAAKSPESGGNSTG